MGSAVAAPSSPSSPPRQTRSNGLPAPLPAANRRGKRRRNTGADDGDATDHRQPKRSKHNHPTISFEEVYSDGHAEYRHVIVEFPPDSGDWFILRCEKCGLHFGRNALQGGAKHLNGARHGFLRREWALAVQKLGVRVLGCDEKKAKINNDAFDQALKAGYVPYKRHNDGRAAEAAAENSQRQVSIEASGDDEDHGRQQQQQQRETHHLDPRISTTTTDLQQGQHRGKKAKPFEGVTDPTVGKLYRAWYRGKGFYAVLMLPLGSFETVGVVGNISNMDKQEKAPACYHRSGDGRILRWASGYEDGGPRVRERKFPVMYFEESANLSFQDDHSNHSLVVPPSLGWVAAKHLRPLDINDPECQNRTRGFKNAQILLRRASMSGISAGEKGDRGSG